MGGSRRRLKKTQPKVRVGLGPLKRKKNEKTRLPLEIAEQRPSIKKRLHTEAAWCAEATLPTNYSANQLVLNPNQSFGRNTAAEPLVDPEQRHAEGQETYSDDDELRAGCNLERKVDKAPPPRLTAMQKKVVTQLMAKHGEDFDAMVLDTKLNPMQHSAGQLCKLVKGFHHWQPLGDKARHDFHGPQKRFKRL